MRQESKLAMICVNVSSKGWPCFMAFVPFRLSRPAQVVSAELEGVAA
jgi:hypothetical protein